jgi:hypothetical protein
MINPVITNYLRVRLVAIILVIDTYPVVCRCPD